MKTRSEIKAMQRALLAWYDASGRTLPWRIRPEDRANSAAPDPYAVWLSEIMLQQTTVPHATPYWHKFLARYPAVTDLAKADRDEVLSLWAGLGYYARARNLHKCAGVVVAEHGGEFPNTEAGLLKLPGIGAYTAATIAAICFNEATNIVDGNVERVISRVFRVQNPLPPAKSELRALAGTLADPDRPGDYGQALMDLGATICRPKTPDCVVCVWNNHCAAFDKEDMLDYPKKRKKKPLPVRRGAVFWLQRGNHVLLRRRPDKGLLGGMMELPGTDWTEDTPAIDALMAQAPAARNWQEAKRTVTHVFTHFKLELRVFSATLNSDAAEKSGAASSEVWAPIDQLEQYALPTCMTKAVEIVTA